MKIIRNYQFHKLVRVIVTVSLSFLFVSPPFITGAPQTEKDENCLICHTDPSLVKEVNGHTVSLYVKEGILTGTVHEGNGCVSCHPGADVEDFPHDSPLEKVDCSMCHEEAAALHAASLHGEAFNKGDPDAPSCADCHGKHDIRNNKDINSPTYIMNIPGTCGKCHKDGNAAASRSSIRERDIVRNYSMSIHGQGLFEGGLIVTAVCTSCHTSHNILHPEDPNSSINSNNITETCMQCHAQIERVHRKVINGELWEKQPEVVPVCIDCHSPHKIRRVFYAEEFTDRYCLTCHSNPSLSRTNEDGSIDTLYTNVHDIQRSMHGEGITCIKCHTNIHPGKSPVCKDAGQVDCSICHAAETDDFHGGIHGIFLQRGDSNAPTCTECHSTHDILGKTDSKSPTFPRNVPNLCGTCHREGEQAAIRNLGKQKDVVSNYSMSIHGKGLFESGLLVSATCTNCHTSHKMLPASDTTSAVHPSNVGETCGQCHLGIYEQYQESIHGAEVSSTGHRLPTCNDCHKSHEIGRVDKDDFRNEIYSQCGECHHEVVETYFETYHGKVSNLGYTKAAKCYDCHGAHNILPPNETASTLSHKNVVETCKKCHPNSNRKFTGYLTHATHHNKTKYPVLYYTFWAMTFLVIGVFVFFGIHTLLWLPRSLQQRLKHKEMLAKKPDKYMVRFRIFPRILHLMVIVSFMLLALTGMSLKFSTHEWALGISKFFGGVQGAGIVHRISAIITFAYFLLHFVYIFQNARKEKKKIFKYMFSKEGMVPTWNDVKQFFQSIFWFLGNKKQPQYGRWTYWEKFDYLAVFWGVAMIGVSGLILWFPEFFTRFLPGWMINVATIIHSDEALLATGFIFTIHFFNTHFRPQKFPMDPVIFTGKVPYEEWKHERPAEYEMLKEKGKLEEHIDKTPPPRWLVISAKIFGGFCVFLGFSLVILIIWAMLTQYK